MKKQTTICTLKKKTVSTRRAKGQGTVWQERNGKWRGQISIGLNSDGSAKRRSFTGATQEDVQRKMNDFIQLFNVSAAMPDPVCSDIKKPVKKNHITVAQIVHRWLWDYKRIEICAKTCEWYMDLIHNMIESHIGGLALYRVNPMVVQNLINRLILVDGYAVRTVRGVRSVLVQSFAFACQLGLMQTNPAAEIKMPKVRKRTKKDDKKVIPHDVCVKVLQAAQDDPMMRVTVTTLLFSGLRIGELLALRWGDIDFENKIITVDEAVVRRPIYNEQGDKIALKSEIADPKTDSSYRAVRMPLQVAEALQNWKKHLREECYGGWRVKENSFVFANKRTKKPHTYTGFRSIYYHFLERNGLRQYGLNLHSYRHTYATMLMEAGTNPKVVQNQLGHASINTTLGIYTHMTELLSETASTALETAYQSMKV